jgi:hypothetical protein
MMIIGLVVAASIGYLVYKNGAFPNVPSEIVFMVLGPVAGVVVQKATGEKPAGSTITETTAKISTQLPAGTPVLPGSQG